MVNEVVWTYNNFRQSIQTYQSHFGAVNTSTTASVQMGYADGLTNTIRPTSLTYPNGRSVTYNYGTSGGITDAASQIASFIDSDEAATDLADFSYLGLGTVVQQQSTQASLQYTLVSTTGNDPVTGDIYSGLDLFGRVKDNRWQNTTSVADLSRTQYGYNRDSSRIWRANPTAPSENFDWLYGYDGLQRVSNGTRGTLNGTQTAITSPQFAQCWQLDSTGNWQGFQQDDTGSGTWDQVQSRTANPVNEILQITDSATGLSATPTYDANGNLIGMPMMGAAGLSWFTLTADQWSTLTAAEWSTLPVAPGNSSTYDAWNRLMSVGDSATAALVQQNQYDGRNYRTVIENYTSGTLSETRNVYYTDDWQDVEERLGTTPDTATPDRQFVWGLQYIDSLILRDRSVEGTLDERFYTCQDANWNVTAIVDTTGTVQERYEYDPYGNVTFLSPDYSTVLSASAYAWETLYAGYRYDSGTGLYVARNRFYLPQFGIWLSRDPIGYAGGMNIYEYVGGQATNSIDPFGTDWFTPSDYISPSAYRQGVGEYWGYFWGTDTVPYVDSTDSAMQYTASAAKGVIVGAAATGVVIVAAPLAISAGTAVLGTVMAGETAAVVATAGVTGTLAVGAAVGTLATAVDTAEAWQVGDWSQVAFNAGTFLGGYLAGGLGPGHRLVTAMGGKPSKGPITLNPFRLCEYERLNRFKSGGKFSFFSPQYWATAPTPWIGSLAAAATYGLLYGPSSFSNLLDLYDDYSRAPSRPAPAALESPPPEPPQLYWSGRGNPPAGWSAAGTEVDPKWQPPLGRGPQY